MQYIEGNIIAPESMFYGHLLYELGVIKGFHSYGSPRAGADWIVPGFIDMRIRGFGELRCNSAEQIYEMAALLPSAGVTSFLPTVEATVHSHLRSVISEFADASENIESAGAKIAGLHLEGPFINPAKKGWLNEKFLCAPDLTEMRKWIELARGTLRAVTFSPECENAFELIRMLTEYGIAPIAGFTECSAERFKQAADMGCLQMATLYNNCEPREMLNDGVQLPSVTDIALLDNRIALELVFDGEHVPSELLIAAKRIAGTERIIAVSNNVCGAGLKENEMWQLADGREYYSYSGEAAFINDENETLYGGCIPHNQIFARLINEYGFTPCEASRAMSANPARALAIEEDTGEFKLGKDADIIVLAPNDFSVKRCIICGEDVKTDL